MICPKCHGIIPDNSKFCTLCGTKIEVQSATQTASSDRAQKYSQPAGQIQGVPGNGSTINLNNVTAKASSAAKQLAGNVDFKNLNSIGCVTIMAVAWLVILIGCFTGVFGYNGDSISFQQFAEMFKTYLRIDLHFDYIVALIAALMLAGFYAAFTAKSKWAVKVQTCFGIGSLITSSLLSMIFGFILMPFEGSSMSELLTFTGWVSCLLSFALFIVSVIELRLLCQSGQPS